MMNSITRGIVSCATMGILVSGCCTTSEEGAATQPQSAIGDKPLSKEIWTRVSLQATVVSINVKQRIATLKGPLGNLVTLSVSENLERINEIKPGDTVEAEYLTFLRADFRAPTAAEKAVPLVVLVEAGKAPKDVAPAGEVGAVVRAVVEVVGINLEGKEVAIRGPRGKFLIMPVEDESILKNLKIDESVIMTYGEAFALTLEKVEEK
jgi:hypothetical protein